MSDNLPAAADPGEQLGGAIALPGLIGLALDVLTGKVRRTPIDRSARGRWAVPPSRACRLRIFRPAAEPGPVRRVLPPLYWRVDGHRLEVVLYPPSDNPPATDAQRHPSSGIWVTVRLA